MEEIEKARRECRDAELMLNFADPDFIEHAVCRVNAARSQFNALIRAAKKQGLQAWPEPLPLGDEQAGPQQGLTKLCPLVIGHCRSLVKDKISR